jgi:hypothetical protein
VALQQLPQNLAPIVTEILNLDPSAYRALTAPPSGNTHAKEMLQRLAPGSLLLPGPQTGRADPQAMLAGLWLWHDWLHESHAISQSLQTPTGSFWHAIMHRREGDFSNSKYWYARVTDHPVLQALGQQAGSIVNAFPADNSVLRMIAQGWKPAAWVDLVETVHDSPTDPRHAIAVQLQQLEWNLLFAYCARP